MKDWHFIFAAERHRRRVIGDPVARRELAVRHLHESAVAAAPSMIGGGDGDPVLPRACDAQLEVFSAAAFMPAM
jgi:hypothetical protein